MYICRYIICKDFAKKRNNHDLVLELDYCISILGRRTYIHKYIYIMKEHFSLLRKKFPIQLLVD